MWSRLWGRRPGGRREEARWGWGCFSGFWSWWGSGGGSWEAGAARRRGPVFGLGPSVIRGSYTAPAHRMTTRDTALAGQERPRRLRGLPTKALPRAWGWKPCAKPTSLRRCRPHGPSVPRRHVDPSPTCGLRPRSDICACTPLTGARTSGPPTWPPGAKDMASHMASPCLGLPPRPLARVQFGESSPKAYLSPGPSFLDAPLIGPGGSHGTQVRPSRQGMQIER